MSDFTYNKHIKITSFNFYEKVIKLHIDMIFAFSNSVSKHNHLCKHITQFILDGRLVQNPNQRFFVNPNPFNSCIKSWIMGQRY